MHPVWHILWIERSENGAECLNAILIFRDYFSFNGGQKAANGRQEVEDGLTELASSSTTEASDCASLRSLHDYYAQCRACAMHLCDLKIECSVKGEHSSQVVWVLGRIVATGL
jgi:hypothetical protein